MTTRQAWVGRWVGAVAVAAAVAVWPAGCAQADDVDPVGAPAKLDFTLKDMDGKDVRLSDFKGRPLLVNFWATWCGPCKEEIPIFVELVEKYKAQQFAVLGVSVNDTADDLRQFAPGFRVNYPLLVGDGHDDLLEAYEAVFSVPVSWLIRRDGTVHLKKIGPGTREWFESQIQALF
jgi:thiol-disulfide isomerase/thioredoxin